MTYELPEAEGLFAALARLDRILERAVSTADAAFGSGAASDPYRGLYVAPDDVRRLLSREAGQPLLTGAEHEAAVRFPALTRLAALFDLSPFDQNVLMVALAPEIDSRYERLYGYLQDDVTKRKPSVELVLSLLCDSREAKLAARTRLSAGAPLIEHRLVHLLPDPNVHLPSSLSLFVKIDDSVVRFLLGQISLDTRLRPCCHLWLPDLEMRPSLAESGLSRLEGIAQERRNSHEPLRLYFKGMRKPTKIAAAQTLAAWLPAPLLCVDVPRLVTAEWELLLPVIFQESLLNGAVIFFEDCDRLREASAAPLLHALEAQWLTHGGVSIFEGRAPWNPQPVSAITVVFAEPDFADRHRAWSRELAAAGLEIGGSDIEELAARYRLDPGEIGAAVEAAASQALLSGTRAGAPGLFEAAREQCRRDIGPMAQRIQPAYGWDDLVLAGDTCDQLQEIVDHARYRRVVFEDWGFDRKLSQGKGLTALFCGPPGTGKTMAAEVIAAELKLDLYRIDLSQVVSKYIGETEKNLSHVFEEAGAGSCVLFFDECDALFGKRTELKDAHDRYANIEVAYLLQRIDDYEGLCVLATNLKQNLDAAFVRRIRFILDIEFPGVDSRAAIWQRVWPKQLPLGADVDPAVLARQFRFSGASIRSVALAAAFLAAADHAPAVTREHVERAARRELEKTGRRAVPVESTPAPTSTHKATAAAAAAEGPQAGEGWRQ